MTKRVASGFFSLLLIVLSVRLACAGSSAALNELARCRKIFAYSGGFSAYYFGFYNRTLCSSRVLPGVMTRTVETEGNILSVCHDDNCAYALYKNGYEQYAVMCMNMNDGSCRCFPVAQGQTVQHGSFAAVGGEVMTVVITAGGSAVWSQTGGEKSAKYTYSFSSAVKDLFVNDNRAYALTARGELYEIGGGAKRYCGDFSAFSGFANAGQGYFMTEERALVSVSGSVEYTNAKPAVKSGGVTVTADSALLLACSGGKAVALRPDYTCEEVVSGEALSRVPESAENTQEKTMLSGNTALFDEGKTVGWLKNNYSNVISVRDADGNGVDSGVLKTGYEAVLSDGVCRIAVGGDVDCSGTVTARDIKDLMRYLIGDGGFSGSFLFAADMNGDSAVDNRDLLLLARAAEKK